MRRFLVISAVLALSISTSRLQAQSSESTQDWPVIAKVTVASVGIVSLAATLGGIGTANSEPETESGESQSNHNNQLYIQELSDELLTFLSDSKADDEKSTFAETIDSMRASYPVLAAYYNEILIEHPDFIQRVDNEIEGSSRIQKMNTLMRRHLFAGT